VALKSYHMNDHPEQDRLNDAAMIKAVLLADVFPDSHGIVDSMVRYCNCNCAYCRFGKNGLIYPPDDRGCPMPGFGI